MMKNRRGGIQAKDKRVHHETFEERGVRTLRKKTVMER